MALHNTSSDCVEGKLGGWIRFIYCTSMASLNRYKADDTKVGSVEEVGGEFGSLSSIPRSSYFFFSPLGDI